MCNGTVFDADLDTNDGLFVVEGDLLASLFVDCFLAEEDLLFDLGWLLVFDHAEFDAFFVEEEDLVMIEATVLLVLELDMADALMEIELINFSLNARRLFHLAVFEDGQGAELAFQGVGAGGHFEGLQLRESHFFVVRLLGVLDVSRRLLGANLEDF